MAEFYVDVDLTVSVQMYIVADNQEKAEQIALEKVIREPGYYARSGAYVNAEVVDCYESEERAEDYLK